MTTDAPRQVPGSPGPDVLRRLPEALRGVAYSAARHPVAGAPDCPSATAAGAGAGPAGLAEGANCQLYAYAVLGHFGLVVPALRSSELWADDRATRRVERLRPLDLVLFDAGPAEDRPAGYGAHVGVHVGGDAVLHLCREVGRPAVWSYADFAARPRYARFLGAKRVVGTAVEDGTTPGG
ncbi:cell wall hydrolase [Streptomyces sp. NPDC048248]|uniref:cell wall hydrolase n=1 Tax=Streptomyces sp. NPDC048248 TaxID=3365523 RepID=UPI00371EEFBC